MKNKVNSFMLDELVTDVINSRKNRKLIENNVDLLAGLTIKRAYELQNKIIKGLNKDVVGWKLGGTNVKTRKTFNVSELYWGAVFEGDITNDASKVNLDRGEVEVAFRFNANIDSLDHEITPLDLENYIESVALSIEYPWSVFKDFGNAGVLALITDCCASGMCLLGESIPFSKFQGSVSVDVKIDGSYVESGSTESLVDGLYNTLCDFINNALSNGVGLKGKQWVFTGGITTCRSYPQDAQLTLSCNGLLGISFLVS